MSAEPLTAEAETWREAAGIILRNWRDEITILTRALFSGTGVRPAPATCLVISPAEVAAKFVSDGREDDLGCFPRTAAGAEALAARLARAGLMERGGGDALLQFDDAAVLRSQLRLPRASNSALHGALGFELDRLSPIPPAELYFDFVLESHDKATNRAEIASRALRRRVVDDAANFAQSAGLAVAAIRLGDDAQLADWRHFPIDRGALLRGLWRRWGSALLAALAVVLFLALLLAMTSRAAAQSEALSARLDDEGVRAASVARLERQMAVIRGQAAFVAQRRAGTTFVAVLAALTDALPDDTWLTEIQLDGGKLHIQGFSRAASNLIARLDRSGRFSNTQFGAPLVRNDADGTERFDLTAKVVGAP